jgi:hypothetical protein
MSAGVVLSLCDYTGNMVLPWAEAGYDCWCVDTRNPDERGADGIMRLRMDVRNFAQNWKWRMQPPVMVFAFPPCTNLAVSGALHFKRKGMRTVIEALEIVESCRQICEDSGSPWMLENPVSTLSTYWREPDYIFDPYEFATYFGGENDNYTKRTCLWTGGGFVLPEKRPNVSMPLFGIEAEEPDDRIHKCPPSEERANIRSATPMGFSRAVFEANSVDTRANFHGGSNISEPQAVAAPKQVSLTSNSKGE